MIQSDNEFDVMFSEVQKQFPNVTPEQYSLACRNVLDVANPQEQLSLNDIFDRVQRELLRIMAQ